MAPSGNWATHDDDRDMLKPQHKGAPMSPRREAALAAVTVVGTLVLVLGIAEVALRFFPVATGLRTVEVDDSHRVFHFTPNRDFLFSRDWDMIMSQRGHVNNAGFVNDQDYRKDGETPLLAVVGDSYIEAAMVPYPETLQGRLAENLKGRLRVYSFGASGAPLSQYLIWARHAARDYGAQALLINVVGNDFDESLASYRTSPGFWHYVEGANGELQLRLFEYHPGVFRDLPLRSALARYLLFHLQLGARWLELKSLLFGGPAMAAPRYAGNTAADASEARIRDSLAVIDAFFRDLPEYVGLPPRRIAFTVDGFRYPNAAASSAGTYFDLLRSAFLKKAAAGGYDAIDLDPIFFAYDRRPEDRFEFPRDAHWNSLGHKVAFDAVVHSRFLTRIMGLVHIRK
jgi:hypothetical protein